jgi:hypothetical protein
MSRAFRGPARALLPLLLLALASPGCIYSFQAGAFPPHIRTIAIVPFDNTTTRLELTQELHAVLLRNLPRSLGIRVAGEDQADAVLRGQITVYDVSTPNYTASPASDRAQILQRQVTIGVSVEILDLINNEILWDNSGVRGEGQYLETSETEDVGKTLAIDLLVQRIVDGAQSNW